MSYPKFDQYSVVKRIGKNSFYTLYSAIDNENDAPVFLKTFDKKVTDDQKGLLQLFLTQGMLDVHSHPSFCKLYRCGKDRNHHYIATEHIDLANDWFSMAQENTSLSYTSLISVITKVAIALRNAHLAGIIHGTLNPNCIYVGPNLDIKIDGFGFHALIPGLAKQFIRPDDTLKHYLAPEVTNGSEEITGKADIYSLSKILFHIMSGYLPFYGNNFLSQRENRMLVSEAESLFVKTLTPNTDERIANLKDFIEELERIDSQIFEPSTVREVADRTIAETHEEEIHSS